MPSEGRSLTPFSSVSPATSGLERSRPSAPTRAAVDGAMTGRIGYVETIRGLTCFFVVLYHAIGNDPSHGLHAEAGTVYWGIARVLDLVDMPLFAFVSGRVFGIPTGDGRRFLAAYARKMTRLGIPLLSVTTLLLVIVGISGLGPRTTVVAAFTQPFEHLWFLQTSLLLTSLAALGSWIFAERRLTFAIAAALLAGVTYLTTAEPAVNVFSWFNAVVLAPYYFLGHLLAVAAREGKIGFEGRGDGFDTALFGAFLAFGLLALWAEAEPFEQSMEVFRDQLLIGLAVVLLLVTHAPRSRLLAKLAERSYTIYLFHVFVLAPTRMIVVKVWPTAPMSVLLIASLTAGIVLPWMLHAVLARHRLTAFLFQGVMPAGWTGARERVRA